MQRIARFAGTPTKHGHSGFTNYGCRCTICSNAQRSYTLQRRYGITAEEFDARIEAQGGRCAICRTDTPSGNGDWHVDHCHNTGKVRGLLCHHCNVGLGNLGDDPDRVQAAANYLREIT